MKDSFAQPPELTHPSYNKPVPSFLGLVTKRHPLVPRWIYRLFRGDADDSYGFSVNFADVQRMHMRLLQGRLSQLALSAAFDDDHGIGAGVLTELGPTLRDYGKVFSSAAKPARSTDHLQPTHTTNLLSTSRP